MLGSVHKSVGFESTLNILWVCLGAFALGVLGGWELRRKDAGSCQGLATRVLAVILALIFLFPCVSASDDLLSVRNLVFTLESRGEVGNSLPHGNNDEKPGLHLTRLFENLQHFRIAAPCSIHVAFGFFALILLPGTPDRHHHLQCLGGRAPPLPALS